ncbi:4Fe-4S dicluster domain-containing protein [bacterium]|nr:4Fe-4S dicluster domain-containing protein [bacterium]
MTQTILARKDFQRLIDVLRDRGYSVIAPTEREGAIVYDEIKSANELPVGKTDEQSAGRYRLRDRNDQALFGYVVGPQSWKKYLHPPRLRLWSAKRNGSGFKVESNSELTVKRAFIGVRSCELNAILIQDKVFISSQFVDPHYQSRRDHVFIVAVNCTEAGGTCFCASMNTGPKATQGFDLTLTEVIEDQEHHFVFESGTELGKEVLDELPGRAATESEIEKASRLIERARQDMGRSLDTTGIKELLYENQEHPRWDHVAERCLSCTNCTMVCPTCFCTNVEDVTDLTGETAERWRHWDSCFTGDFSYVHGGAIRPSTKARYRQWMTHKLASWIDQFGTSGCVGCGRCITWCPVGIDITEEVQAIREDQQNDKPSRGEA